MVGVFAAATARLTPEFLESFDPEKLASKFVRVEREFGVKFTKSKSTFNIVGHWEAVRNAHRSLLKLKFNEKFAEKYSKKREKCKEKTKTAMETPITETDSGKSSHGAETHLSETEIPLFRGKGNPKRGRHAPKESMYSAVPEPVFFLQYQDKTFTDAGSLDIDSVLEDFEKSQLDKKVTKEELKKILEKNKDQMGKPLEKGIPKGAIIPVPKIAEESCDSLDLNSPSKTSASSGVYGTSDPNVINSYSYIKAEQMTQNSTMTSVENFNSMNSAMITTYSVNARMSTYNMDMITNNNQEIEEGTTVTAVGQINVEDFYNHPDENDRLVTQLPESVTDSFCGMFENYDPQSMLNPIPSSEKSLNRSEGTGTTLQPVNVKLAVCDDVPGQSESNDVSMKEDSVSRICAEIKSDFSASPLTGGNDQFDTNGVKNEMNGYGEIASAATFEDFTELSANSSHHSVLQNSSSVADFVNISMASDDMPADAQSNNVSTNIPIKSEIGTTENSSMTNPDLKSLQREMELIEGTEVSMPADIKSDSYPSNVQIQAFSPQSVSDTNASLDDIVTTETSASSMRLPHSGIPKAKEPCISKASQENGKIDGIETQDGKTAGTAECQKQLFAQLMTRDGNLGCTEASESTEMTADNFEQVENNTDGQHIDQKAEKTADIVSAEIKERNVCEKVPDATSKSSDRTNTIRRNKIAQSQNKTGKIVSPLKIKKTRLSRVSVKDETLEKIDKDKKKRGRKPKISVTRKGPVISTSDSKINTSKDTSNESTRQSERFKDKEKSEQKMLDTQNSDKSNTKEKAKRKIKEKEEKTSNEIKERQIYKCTECDYQGYRKKRLTEHMGRVHGLLSNGTQPENPMFTCDECEKTFVFEKDLNRHKKIVHHGQVFVCLICHKNYKSKYVFDRHTATHEEGYIQPKFRCQICEREFTTKFSLSSHIKSEHLGMKKTYSCPTCGKTFSQIRSYRQHANVHAGIRPYTCEVCGKSFTYDKSLKEHRYMHDTVRRFQCTVCQKAFRQQTCLLIHMKTHKEKKDHICSVCGREFTQKQSLLRHERIHTGDKPYSCKICFKSFGDYAVIRKHVMMAHKKSKDSWKDDIFTEEKKRSSHYIDGGPGYVPRESYAKLHQKNQAAVIPPSASESQIMIAHIGQEPHMIRDPPQQGFGNSFEDLNRTRQPDNEITVSSQGDLNTLRNIYQASAYPETLDFSVMDTLKPKQQDNFTSVVNVPVNYSLIQNVGGDSYNSIGTQQPNLNIKSYPYSLTISPLVKDDGASGDAYAAQFLNHPTSDSVSMETNSVSMTEVQAQMLNSSTSNVSVAISDSTVSDTAVTMATTNNGWGYQGYSAAYFSPVSFSQYQSAPDT